MPFQWWIGNKAPGAVSGARGAGKAASIDSSGTGGNFVYNEITTARGAGSASETDTLSNVIANEITNVFGAGKAAEFRVGSLFTETTNANGAGKCTSLDHTFLADLILARGAGAASELDVYISGSSGIIYFESTFARGAAKVSGVDRQIALDSALVLAAARAGSGGLALLTDSPRAKGAGFASQTGGHIWAATSNAIGAGSSGVPAMSPVGLNVPSATTSHLAQAEIGNTVASTHRFKWVRAAIGMNGFGGTARIDTSNITAFVNDALAKGVAGIEFVLNTNPRLDGSYILGLNGGSSWVTQSRPPSTVWAWVAQAWQDAHDAAVAAVTAAGKNPAAFLRFTGANEPGKGGNTGPVASTGGTLGADGNNYVSPYDTQLFGAIEPGFWSMLLAITSAFTPTCPFTPVAYEGAETDTDSDGDIDAVVEINSVAGSDAASLYALSYVTHVDFHRYSDKPASPYNPANAKAAFGTKVQTEITRIQANSILAAFPLQVSEFGLNSTGPNSGNAPNDGTDPQTVRNDLCAQMAVQKGIVRAALYNAFDDASYSAYNDDGTPVRGIAVAPPQFGAADMLIGLDRPGANGALKGGGTVIFRGIDTPNAKGAGEAASGAASHLFLESGNGKGAARAGLTDVAISLDSPNAKAGVNAGVIDRAILTNSSTAKGAGLSSLTDARVIVESANARGAGKSGTTDALTVTDSSGAKGAGRAGSLSIFDPSSLISNIRRNIASAAPELTAIVEGVPPNEDAISDLVLPYLSLVFGPPQQDQSYAVHDQAHWVPAELVYVAQTTMDGATDTPEVLRSKLKAITDALLTDYTQAAGTGVGSCALTELQSTPMDRQTEYQKHFAELGQNVTIMVSTLAFLTVENL